MLANREGLFHGYPIEIGLDEQGNNKLACYSILFHIFEERLNNGEWADVAAEDMEITGWFYLETKDGQGNDFTINSLKAAFGWDGRDPFWLQDNAEQLAQLPVQMKLAFEEYDGNTRLKVQFLNPYGSIGGGVSKADDTTRRNINNRLGSKLRARAGGTPAQAPKPEAKPKAETPAGLEPSPPSPAPQPSASAQEPPQASAASSMDEGLGGFLQDLREGRPSRQHRRGSRETVVRRVGQALPGQTA